MNVGFLDASGLDLGVISIAAIALLAWAFAVAAALAPKLKVPAQVE